MKSKNLDATQTYRYLRDNVMESARLLQNNEQAFIRALTDDQPAQTTLRELSDDLFSLIEGLTKEGP